MTRLTRLTKNSVIVCFLKENHFRYLVTGVKSKGMEKDATSEYFGV